jgi:hypothetical protein
MPEQNLTDKTITCSDCGGIFQFTAREQAFYQEKQLSQPKRCKDCRAKKKAAFAARQSEGGYKHGR